MPVETPEMKATFEAALAKARSISILKQARARFQSELALLPQNAVHVQMKGLTLTGEKKRIEGEIARLSQQEQNVRQEIREWFSASVENARQKFPQKMDRVVLSGRRRLHVLLAEAATIYAAIEAVPVEWQDLRKSLEKIAQGLAAETGESYAIADVQFPSPLVPIPSSNTVIRARERSDNTGTMLAEMAKQIS